MVEFFQNVGKWFVDNKDSILLVLTSTNFATFISLIVLVVKQIFATKRSTVKVEGVTETLHKTNELAENVTDVSKSTKITEDNVKNLQKELEQVNAKLNESLLFMQQKLDAMIDVQSIVYSTIRDDTIRQNVANTLNSAKFYAGKTKADMEKEIERLKQVIEETVSTAHKSIEEVKEKSKVKSTTKSAKSDIQRY